MNLYEVFEANPEFEKNGIWVDYGSFRIKIRYAGGQNKQYQQLLEIATKPFRRVIDQGAFPEDRMRGLLQKIYAKAIVVDWETAVTDSITGEVTWEKGIQDRNGDLMSVTEENLLKTFQALPNLFIEILQQATATANFRMAELEADGKNSKKS